MVRSILCDRMVHSITWVSPADCLLVNRMGGQTIESRIYPLNLHGKDA